jgi:hypothetical protein
MKVLVIEIMQTVLDIIHQTVTGLERDDPTRLRLVELRPRAEEFADVSLSCTISHNDPDDWDKWNDEEAAAPGSAYVYYSGKRHLETGLNQPMNLRFTVDFVLFFQDLGLTSEKAIKAAEIIMARIHHAILWEGQHRGRFGPLHRGDDFGHKVVNATRAVKRMRMLPQGSDEETFFKGKMWLQFETLYEPKESI